MNESPEPAPPPMPPWEYPETVGYLRAFFGTLSGVLTAPTRVFRSMHPTGNVLLAFSYALLVNFAAFLVAFIGQHLTGFSGARSMEGLLRKMGAGQIMRPDGTSGLPFDPALLQTLRLWLVPILFGTAIIGVVVSLLLQTAAIHLCLVLLGGAGRTFETTFRVMCYCQGSAAVFNAVPYVGWIPALTWQFFCLLPALREQHGAPTSTVVLALLIAPGLMMLCCCCAPLVPFAVFYMGAFHPR